MPTPANDPNPRADRLTGRTVVVTGGGARRRSRHRARVRGRVRGWCCAMYRGARPRDRGRRSAKAGVQGALCIRGSGRAESNKAFAAGWPRKRAASTAGEQRGDRNPRRRRRLRGHRAGPPWDRVMTVNARHVAHDARAEPAVRRRRPHREYRFRYGTVGTRRDSLAYVTSKGAVISMTRSLARELGPRGIGVTAVAPGIMRNEATEYVPAARHQEYERGRARCQSPDPRGYRRDRGVPAPRRPLCRSPARYCRSTRASCLPELSSGWYASALRRQRAAGEE